MAEVRKGRLTGNANFASLTGTQRKKGKKSATPDSLGTNSIPYKQWPPPHHFLARFFQAPVPLNGGASGGNTDCEELGGDGLVYMRQDMDGNGPKPGERLYVGVSEPKHGVDLITWSQATDPRGRGDTNAGSVTLPGGKITADIGGGTMVRGCAQRSFT